MRRHVALALILSGIGVGTLVAVDAVPFNVRQIVIRNRDDCDNVPKPEGCPGASEGTPLSRNEHPRLWMTLENRPAMLARIETGGEWNSEFQSWINHMTNASVWDSSSTNQITVSSWAAGAGFVYQMFRENGGLPPDGITWPSHANTQQEWADKGTEWVTRIATDPGIFGEYTRDIFLGYDWLHDELTSGERSTIINAWKTTAEDNDNLVASEAAYPSYSGFFYSNSEYSAYYGYWVLACLAAKGDGVQEAWLQTGCDRFNWAFHASSPSNHRAMVSRESQRSGVDGANIQGSYYGQVLMVRLGIMEVAYRTANGISVADYYGGGDRDLVRSWVPYTVRQMHPYTNNTGSPRRVIGDDPGYNQYDSTDNRSFRLASAIARFEFPGWDQDAADLGIWFLGGPGMQDNDPDGFYLTKFLSAKGTGKSPSTLGLVPDKAFQAGKWTFRSGWDSVNDIFINVYAHRFGALNGAGAFTINYGGRTMPLGNYRNHDLDSGTTSYGKAVLAFVDPSRSTCEFGPTNGPCTAGEDYGSSRMFVGSDEDFLTLAVGSTADFDTSPSRFRSMVGDGVGYLTLNLVRHYNGPTVKTPASITEKVSAYRRSWIVFKPGTIGTDPLVLFTFENATAVSTTFQKRLYWTCYAEPTIDGSSAAGPSRAGSTARKTTYTGATNILCSQNVNAVTGSTRYYATPLSPTGFQVVKVQYKFGYDSGTLPYRVCETPYGILDYDSNQSGCWSGEGVPGTGLEGVGTHWRAEVIPTTSQTTDNFATAIEACPNVSCSRSTTSAVTGTDIRGGRVGLKVATNTTTLDDNTFTVVMPDVSATFTVASCGATPNSSRTLSKGGSIGTVTQTITSDTTSPYTFDATGCFVGTVVVTSGGNEASRTLTWN